MIRPLLLSIPRTRANSLPIMIGSKSFHMLDSLGWLRHTLYCAMGIRGRFMILSPSNELPRYRRFLSFLVIYSAADLLSANCVHSNLKQQELYLRLRARANYRG